MNFSRVVWCIYVLFVIVLLSACDNSASRQEVSIPMSDEGEGFIEKIIVTEKFILHENGQSSDVELYETYYGDVHYRIFRVGGENGGNTAVNYTKDSLEMALLKLQIKQMKDGSSSNKKAVK